MRAVILNGPRDVSVETVPDPGLDAPGDAIVRVDRTAICGSDLHLFHGDMGGAGIHLGHEFIGSVVEAGAEVRHHSVGDRVLVSGVVGCGACGQCLSGYPMRCIKHEAQVFGTTEGLWGGQAEYVRVPVADVWARAIPEGISDEQAVLLTDILPTGFLGARRADISPGDVVAVIGLGPVGTFALQSALLHSPARVIAIDPVADRRARAATLGAETIDPTDGGTHAQVLEATGGHGADCVIEAVGSDVTIADAVWCARAGGTVSVVGVNTNMASPFPMPVAMLKGITFRICVADVPSVWDQLFPLVQHGRLHPEEVFTHRMGLSHAAEGYRLFDAREDGVLKVLLDPTD